MFNVTIIRLRDIFKFIFLIILIYVVSSCFIKKASINKFTNKMVNLNTTDWIKLGINTQSVAIKNISTSMNTNEHNKVNSNNFAIENILKLGFKGFYIESKDENIGQEENDLVDNNQIATEIVQEASVQEKIQTDVSTQVVTENPIQESYNKQYNGVKIKNETSYELTDNILNIDSLDIDNKNIIIFHTHTCESYTEGENSKYTATRKF